MELKNNNGYKYKIWIFIRIECIIKFSIDEYNLNFAWIKLLLNMQSGEMQDGIEGNSQKLH